MPPASSLDTYLPEAFLDFEAFLASSFGDSLAAPTSSDALGMPLTSSTDGGLQVGAALTDASLPLGETIPGSVGQHSLISSVYRCVPVLAHPR
jgi:hypothetical protein